MSFCKTRVSDCAWTAPAKSEIAKSVYEEPRLAESPHAEKHTERRKIAGRPAPRSLSQDDHHKKSELAAATTVHAYDVKKPPVGVRFMRPVWKGSR